VSEKQRRADDLDDDVRQTPRDVERQSSVTPLSEAFDGSIVT